MSDAPDLHQDPGSHGTADPGRLVEPTPAAPTPAAATDPAPSAETAAVPSPSAAGDQRLEPGPIEEDLAAVDAALARLDAGSYGTCEVCRDPLDDDALASDPTVRFCAGHLSGTLS